MTDKVQQNRLKEKAAVNVLADSLAQSGNVNMKSIAPEIRNMELFSEAGSYAASQLNLPQNSLIGNIFVFIAKQWVQSKLLSSVYGDTFKLGEDCEVGGGISEIHFPLNTTGMTTPINYQTSTEAAGTIAFGKSFANGQILNLISTIEPLYNYQLNNNNPTSALPTSPFATITYTYPKTFSSFSALSAVKADEILTGYTSQLANQNRLYFYSLGNLLFNSFLPQNQWPDSSNTLIEFLQNTLLPLIERLKQTTANWNAGTEYTRYLLNEAGLPSVSLPANMDAMDGNLDHMNMVSKDAMWYNNLPVWEQTTGYQNHWLQVTEPDKLTIYMNPNVASAFKTLVQTNFFSKDFDIEQNGNIITKIGGIKVKVTGTNIDLCKQAKQGEYNTPGFNTGQVLGDNQIVIVHDDYLTFHKCYDTQLTTETLVASMVSKVMDQKAYLPVVRPWLTGIVINNMNGAFTKTNYLFVDNINK